jgi:hypothetical protein
MLSHRIAATANQLHAVWQSRVSLTPDKIEDLGREISRWAALVAQHERAKPPVIALPTEGGNVVALDSYRSRPHAS